MPIRVFTDRDMGRSVGLGLRAVGIEVQLYDERYPDDPRVPDERWIAEVTAEGYVILSRDGRIRTRPAERAVFERAGARAFMLSTRSATRLQNLRAILIAWPRIELEASSRPAPFMFGIDRTGRMQQKIPPVTIRRGGGRRPTSEGLPGHR